jgi:hypothetical protein
MSKHLIVRLSAIFLLPAAILLANQSLDRSGVYASADRLIRLPDGSDLIFHRPLPPDGKPPLIDAMMISPRDRDDDRAFRLAAWIPGEILEGTQGQLISGAMSGDGKWLAFIGGWASSRDRRGHNGLFVLRQDEQSRYWRVRSWFDAPGLTLGEVLFGPGDTLVVTTQEQTTGGAAPLLTVYSFAGQKLGAAVSLPRHGDPAAARFARESRLARVSDSRYAVLDPETMAIHFVDVHLNGVTVVATEKARIQLPFDAEHCSVFDVLPDGGAVVARTVIANHRGHTVITRIGGTGVVGQTELTETFRYGYVNQWELHGFVGPHDTAVKEHVVDLSRIPAVAPH